MGALLFAVFRVKKYWLALLEMHRAVGNNGQSKMELLLRERVEHYSLLSLV
jgi:hypothetical protein